MKKEETHYLGVPVRGAGAGGDGDLVSQEGNPRKGGGGVRGGG